MYFVCLSKIRGSMKEKEMKHKLINFKLFFPLELKILLCR